MDLCICYHQLLDVDTEIIGKRVLEKQNQTQTKQNSIISYKQVFKNPFTIIDIISKAERFTLAVLLVLPVKF